MKKILYLLILLTAFIGIGQVGAISLYNSGLIEGYGSANTVGRYSCPGKDWGLYPGYAGVIRISDSYGSGESYYCTDCSIAFPSTDEGGSSTAYSYSRSDNCYYTCDSLSGYSTATGSSYATKQHNIWDNFDSYDEISCEPDNDELLNACGTDYTYILTEYSKSGYQSVVAISRDRGEESSPPSSQTGTLTVTKVCDGFTTGNFSFSLSSTAIGEAIACGVTQSVSVNAGTYTFAEVNATNYNVTITDSNGAITDGASKTITVGEGETTALTVTNSLKTGNIKIHKTCDSEINSSTQFSFTITDSNGVVKQTPTVACGGDSLVYELPLGTYTISETPLSNDIKPIDTTTATITASHTESNPYTVNAVNHLITGSIKIRKVDGSGINMAGVKFKLLRVENNVETPAVYASYNVTGEPVGELTTNVNGEITINNLLYGNYRIVELSTPNSSYVLASPVDVTIDNEHKIIEQTIINNPIKLKIIKTNLDGTVALNGSKFMVYEKETGSTLSEVSVYNNTDTYIPLSVGEYTLTETQSPVGYDPLSENFDITVSSTGVISLDDETNPYLTLTYTNNEYVLTVKNDTSKVSFSKKDATTLEELAGAKFKLTTNDGTLVKEWTTKTTPERIYLEEGTYILTEESSPDKYERIETPLTFKVLVDGSIELPADVNANIFYATGNKLVIYNTKPVEVPNTGMGLKIALITTGIVLVGTGVYLLNKKFKFIKK